MLKRKGSQGNLSHGILSFIVAFAALAMVLAGGLMPLKAQAAEEQAVRKAKLFDLKDRKTLLFTYEHETSLSGDHRVATSRYRDPSGKLAIEESVDFAKDGFQLLKYSQSQKQLGTDGSIEVKDGKAKFSYTKDGKTKTSDESIKGDFIVGLTIVPYLQAHWSQLMKGDTLSARLGVLDRLESVGFRYKKEKDLDLDGKKAVMVIMEPEAWVIRQVVDPLHFTLTADGSKLLQIEGRATVKREEKGKFKDLNALTVYE
jgi:hypothetical protein